MCLLKPAIKILYVFSSPFSCVFLSLILIIIINYDPVTVVFPI